MAPKLSKSRSSGKLSIRDRLFRRREPEHHYEEVDQEVEEEAADEAAEEHGAFQRPERLSSLNATSQFSLSHGPPGLFTPASYLNPLVHRMSPRLEMPAVRTRPKHLPLPIPGQPYHPHPPPQLEESQSGPASAHPHPENPHPPPQSEQPQLEESQSEPTFAHPHPENPHLSDKPLPDRPVQDNGPIFPPPKTRREIRKIARDRVALRTMDQRPPTLVTVSRSRDTSPHPSINTPSTLPSPTRSTGAQPERPDPSEEFLSEVSALRETLPGEAPFRTPMQDYEEYGHLWDVPAPLRDRMLAGNYETGNFDIPGDESPVLRAMPDDDVFGGELYDVSDDELYDVSDDGRSDHGSVDSLGTQTFYLTIDQGGDIPDAGAPAASASASADDRVNDIPDAPAASADDRVNDIPDAGATSVDEQSQVDDSSDADADADADITSVYKLPSIRQQAISWVARDAAESEGFVVDWEMYISDYSSGYYALSNPPQPPPRNDNLLFLPAVKALNDRERLMACRMFQPLWERWDLFKPKFALLVLGALEKFKVSGVAVSLFDEDTEFFAVERGMDVNEKLPRSVSLAAHALYANNPMVILDTHEDWRFSRNPLVTGTTDIRFFAATPLVSHDSQAVAVLSIFDSQPRANFTPRERLEIQDFANQLLTNLSHQVVSVTSPEFALSRGIRRGGLYPPLRIPRKEQSKFPPLPQIPGDGTGYHAHQFPPLPAIPRTAPTENPADAATPGEWPEDTVEEFFALTDEDVQEP